MRTRTRDTRTLTSGIRHSSRTKWGNFGGGASAPYGSCGEFSYILDTVTPNYRRRRQSGEVIMNSMEMSRYKRVVSEADFDSGPHELSVSGDYAAYARGWGGPASPSDGYPADKSANIRDIVLVNAYGKIEPKVVAAVENIRDLKQTHATLVRISSAFKNVIDDLLLHKNRRLVRGLASYNYKKTKSLRNDLSNTWLEARYGLTPLIYEFDSVMKELARFKDKNRWQIARSFLSRQKSKTYLLNRSSFSGQFYDLKWNRTVTTTDIASAGVFFKVGDKTTLELIQQWASVRPKDFLSVAWELVPFSFVADWFTNIGRWLAGIPFDVTVQYGPSFVQSHSKVVDSIDGFNANYSSADYGSLGRVPLGGDEVSTFFYIRTKNPAYPAFPNLDCNILIRHLVDAICLSNQAIVGQLKRLSHY